MTRSNLKVVAKFGGTSMADAEAIAQSAKVATENNTAIVVVSATSGTTDQLLELIDCALNKDFSECQEQIQSIKDRHHEIAKNLSANQATIDHIDHVIDELNKLIHGLALIKEATPKSTDIILSVGERLSSPLILSAMTQLKPTRKPEYLDARDIIETDDRYGNALPDIDATSKNARDIRDNDDVVFVTQGFIAKSGEGETTTLGRGGSDYSASLFAEAIGADELQIWTDVSGIATTDPRLVENTAMIEDLSFQEAAELATSGAKIIHPPTMIPARRAKIPIFVGNTFAPADGGTWIRDTATDTPLVRAITLRDNQGLVTLTTPRMSQQFGFLATVFAIFSKHKISIDQVSTSEVSVAITVESDTLQNKKLFSELEEVAEVAVEQNLALVSLIGNRVNHTTGLARDVFTGLQQGGDGIMVRMICQGASKHNLCFLVGQDDGAEAVKRLHKEFIE